ncbi:MAG TPA: S8 family serine peptidase [Streptosporangiaceae bacterium]
MIPLGPELPWRLDRPAVFPGVPAWGALTASSPPDPVALIPQPSVTPEWTWGGSDGSGVRVCVLDSGVDASHTRVGPLARSVAVGTGPDGQPEIADCAPEDRAGHGTACAGIIRSVAPGVELCSVRVLTDGKFGSGAALLAGLGWAIDQGYDIINLSLATTRMEFCSALHELADRAYFRRSILVTSASNMPVRSYPWTFSSVLSVASHNEGDPLTYYYNPSPPVDFYAMGVGVPVAVPGAGEMRLTGNSFAAPHLAGIIARILAKHPYLTPFQLKTLLYLNARNVAELNRSPG